MPLAWIWIKAKQFHLISFFSQTYRILKKYYLVYSNITKDSTAFFCPEHHFRNVTELGQINSELIPLVSLISSNWCNNIVKLYTVHDHIHMKFAHISSVHMIKEIHLG